MARMAMLEDQDALLFERFRNLFAHGRTGVRIVLLYVQLPFWGCGLPSSLTVPQRVQERVNPQPREPGSRPRPIFISACWDDGKRDRAVARKRRPMASRATNSLTHAEDTPTSLNLLASCWGIGLSPTGHRMTTLMLIADVQPRHSNLRATMHYRRRQTPFQVFAQP